MESARSILLEPKAIFFWTSELRDADWESCFYLKAAAVYSGITKRQADAVAMPIASKLLISMAENCSLADAPRLRPSPAAAPSKEGLPSPAREIEPQTDKPAMLDLPSDTKEAIDAIYLVVGILHDLKDTSGKSPNREKLDAHYAYSRRHDAISDVVKLRNQLPLHLLLATVENFQTALQKAVESLKIDGDLSSSIKAFRLSFDKGSFYGAVRLFCWYYSPFHSKAPSTTGNEEEVFSGKENLLQCLHSSLEDVSSLAASARGDASKLVEPPLPSAARLVQSGLGFWGASDGKIKAQFSNVTLHIPALVFDSKLETVVMNLLEWERLRERVRPVARYLLLLRELVEDEGDVRVLGKARVLRGRWRKEGEVVEFLRRVERFASCPSAYPPIDDEVEGVRKAHGEWAGKFMVRYGSTLVWTSTATLVSLLLAAAIAAAKRRGR